VTEKLVELTARAWGTRVGAPPSRRFRCSVKDFPENPQGQEYVTQAYGSRAEAIVRKYEELGLLSGERERKLKRLERKLGRPIFDQLL